jgi:hypothetical protein
VTKTIRLVRVTCRFGGARPYFIYPGVLNGTACGRAVAKLYGPGRYYVCRHCHRLSYASQSEDAVSRSMPAREQDQATPRRQHRDSLAISAEAEGMWRRTYERLREQAFDAEERADEALALALSHLARRGFIAASYRLPKPLNLLNPRPSVR